MKVLPAALLALATAGLPALAAQPKAPADAKPAAATETGGSAAKPAAMKVASRKKVTHRHRHHVRTHTPAKTTANKPAAATK
ncbi:MAG TPA: hypothetical protein VKW76_02375 [Candidatus Binatia bacterium]|nr:hypothetical protein [Candidatus Binatia bacterium]